MSNDTEALAAGLSLKMVVENKKLERKLKTARERMAEHATEYMMEADGGDLDDDAYTRGKEHGLDEAMKILDEVFGE